MQTETILLILLAAIVSIAVVLFQYFHSKRKGDSLNYVLSFLRFIAIFGALLLLINPKLEKNDYFLEKSKLVLLIDNSSSMAEIAETEGIRSQIDKIVGNTDLEERFDIESYSFSRGLGQRDSLSFDQSATNIASALAKTKELYSNSQLATLLFTDGNQTEGTDYEFIELGDDFQVFSVVVGDTTKYRDLAIGQVNLNKYAFLNNQFPIEVTVLHQGTQPANANLRITLNGNSVHEERLTFAENEKSKSRTIYLKANAVGIKSVVVSTSILEGERNTANNRKESAIEVIDEQTNIALISDMVHPDLGALKKSIESNEQRSVTILKPSNANALSDAIDLVLLYQPNSNFRTVYESIKRRQIPTFTITGSETDYRFLNQINQSVFSIDTGYPEQELFGSVNSAFPHFDISETNLNEYPPLLSNSGPVNFKLDFDVLLDMEIKGTEMDTPLMALASDEGQKNAFLFGENIWKWRIQNFRNDGNFEMFDRFMGKLMVYLSKSGKRNRLEVNYEKVYEGQGLAKIRASFFDETFVLNPNANLMLYLNDSDQELYREIPMLFKGNYFEADLSDLPSGEFDFTVTVSDENITSSGSFKILEFDAEQQFLAADHKKLLKLADNTNGNLYFLNDTDSLITDLATSSQFVPIQKNKRKVVSLIDFRFLLGVIILALTLEWFIRKYNGLL